MYRSQMLISQLGTPAWQKTERIFLAAILLHFPLVILMNTFTAVATVHALLVAFIGLYFLIRDEKPTRLVFVIGYLVGAEVLWRMTSANVFWEYAKYVLVILLILAIFKWQIRPHPVAFLYFLPLLPAIVFTINGQSFETVRQQISFNLSGPLAILMAVWFFWRLSISITEMRRLFLWIILPITGIAVLALYQIFTSPDVIFLNQSNFDTSGGFGPNQVSAILGLAAALGWIYFLISSEEPGRLRWIILGISIWLLAQAIFTFSRGGVLNFAIAAAGGSFFLYRGSPARRRALAAGLILLVIAIWLAVPRLDTLTGSALLSRYQDLTVTGRVELFQTDLQLFQENWFSGVGAGNSAGARQDVRARGIAAHTEYSRLLAEHGIFGLWSLLMLGVMSWQAFKKAKTPVAKGIVVTLLLWALAEMTHSAMRIAAVSFVIGLAMAHIGENKSETVTDIN